MFGAFLLESNKRLLLPKKMKETKRRAVCKNLHATSGNISSLQIR